MAFWRKSAKKQAADCVALLASCVDAKTPDEKRDLDSKLTNDFDDIVTKLYGPRGTDDSQNKEGISHKEQRELVEAVMETDLFIKGLNQIPQLGFEARKKLVWIVQYIITNYKELAIPVLKKNEKIFFTLVNCYHNPDPRVFVNYDNVLSTCIQNKDLCEYILSDSSLVNAFFKYMEHPTDAGIDSFSTFKLLMTEHKGIPAAAYIKKNYQTFFENYNNLLVSNNFCTRVQAFQLLNEILCARINFDVMLKYINEPDNLKLSMMALNGTKAQQMAVFHVLKIFIGNPRKSSGVASILSMNKAKLIAFISQFEKEKNVRLEKDKEDMMEKLLELNE